jgi:DNA-binding MarR family transcriptional regulator
MMVDDARAILIEQAIAEYGPATSLVDPARLQDWEDIGLTMSQLRVLIILNRERGMTAGNLADRLGVRPSTVTGIVDRLVKQDLVERQADPDDRRVVRNLLTPHGSEVINKYSRGVTDFITGIFDKLNDEDLSLLAVALGKLNLQAQKMGLQMPPAPVTEEAPAQS